ncbi:MAG: sel1 repeat family protein [Deltaproteobacteria bacterium]|nr:sel1 repeat family protein [Deltaproteobacteria bacterium]
MSTSTKLAIQERCTRWLLLLTLLHTVPVLWITPVAGGTVPTAVLLAYGVASVLTLDHEGVAIGLMALAPALVYTGIAWLLAWLLGKLLQWVPPIARACLLGCLTVGLLLTVYFPIYLAGGHNSSSSSDLISLFDNTLSHRLLLSYWIALHVVLAALFAGSLLREDHAFTARVERWSRPVLRTAGIVVFGTILYQKHDLFLCRPFAELGFGRAQVCVAKTAGTEERYWYERAAADGNAEAIAWLIDKTPNRQQRLKWLRKGAEEGDPASQFALYEFLVRTQGADAKAEAERWLELAAEGDHAEAQMALVERVSKILYRGQSEDRLAERNAWLERAAKHGSRTAKLRLAQHYRDGSMGYPADLDRARAYYRELMVVDQLTDYERAMQLDASAYQRQLSELDAWQAGLENRDPDVMRAMAKRYLRSQFPGPGVRELGTQLMEQLATDGDKSARDELMLGLRTGSGGVEKNLDAAGTWLLKAAKAGDRESMERLASNYMNGREGFPVDYPQTRRWTEALIALDQGSDEREAQARLQKLRNDLRYIDRLGGYAGSAMLGSSELEQLGRRTDADSQYEHAIQLLVGHGSKRLYERGFPQEIDKPTGLQMLELAVANHHFNATRELAMSLEYGKRGLAVDLPRAIALYEGALEAGHDNRYGWNLDPNTFNHYRWLESRLRQARMKLDAQANGSVAGR